MSNIKKDRLSHKQEKFAREYVLQGCNATQTARVMGVDVRTCTRWLSLPEVSNRVKEIADEIWKAEDERAAEQHKIAIENDMADIGQRTKWLASVVKGDVDDMSIVKGEVVSVPPKLTDRLKASEQLNKMQSCYTQHIDLSGSMPIVINDNVGQTDD